MKKVLSILIIGALLFGVCSAQIANAQTSNNSQRIIGTWVADTGSTWIFNANGILSVSGYNTEFKFVVVDTKLAILDDGGNLSVFNIVMSSDSKTIILDLSSMSGRPRLADPYWLTKK